MAFNPEIHHRRSLRFQGYDYSRDGAYSGTICSYKKESIFSDVGAGLASALGANSEIQLKVPGEIIQKIWNGIPERFHYMQTDEMVIMPNHIHGILFIEHGGIGVDARPTPTPGDIICVFKSECATEYLKHIEGINLLNSCKIWQRNYYDHIIPDEKERKFYRTYIKENPGNWKNDEYFIK